MALTFIMKLLFLHGSPATGKLTVAKALLRMVPGRLMDNHASIDFARQIFDFDAPGFWRRSITSGIRPWTPPPRTASHCWSRPSVMPSLKIANSSGDSKQRSVLKFLLVERTVDEILQRDANPSAL